MLHRSRLLLAFLASALVLTACGDDEDSVTGPGGESYDFGPILDDFANNVVIPTYHDLDAAAGALGGAVAALRDDPTDATLHAARDAWVAARVPWEASEGFLFGPVDFEGYDPALDSWPVNRTDLDKVLAGDDALSAEYVNNLKDEEKGFHTIEYLLFGEGGGKTPADFTEREFEYLVASTAVLEQSASSLHDSWIPSGGNFVSKVVGAGSGSDIYPSQESAVQEIVNGMIGICDEVGPGKIGDPYNEQDPQLVESQFSHNSLEDFQNNMRSVRNAYTGDYGGSEGNGLDEFVAQHNGDLDSRLKSEIQAAIDEIAGISNPFRDAIATDGDQIEKAQEAIAKVSQTLQEDVLPLVIQ